MLRIVRKIELIGFQFFGAIPAGIAEEGTRHSVEASGGLRQAKVYHRGAKA
jgi:hypothetical protein